MALKTVRRARVRPHWNDGGGEAAARHRFFNFIFPMCSRRRGAPRGASTRYPPEGTRGVAVAHRSNRYGTVEHYLDLVNDNVTVIVQIESRAAVGPWTRSPPCRRGRLFIGPSDLAADSRTRQPRHGECSRPYACLRARRACGSRRILGRSKHASATSTWARHRAWQRPRVPAGTTRLRELFSRTGSEARQ